MNSKLKRGITIEREVLLFEIERRCFFDDCKARNFIGLTKPEACEYTGFECSACERRNEDRLARKDIPDWWDEITNSMPSNYREQ